jgi:lipoyl-dependent peroxiredoxin
MRSAAPGCPPDADEGGRLEVLDGGDDLRALALQIKMVEGLAGRQLVRIRQLVCGKAGTSCDHESLEMPFSPMRPSMPGLSRVGESYWKSVAPDARSLRCSKGRPDHGISDNDKSLNLRKTMAYQPLYTAVATATGGRDGHVESSDGIVKLDLSVPREMGGPGKPGTSNPEQLFASGYSACFAGAIGFVANQQHKKLSDIQVTGHVTFGKVEEKSTYNAGGTTYPLPGFQLAVRLDVHLPGVDKSEAEKLVEQAHQVCPYSRATRNNIEVKFAVV